MAEQRGHNEAVQAEKEVDRLSEEHHIEKMRNINLINEREKNKIAAQVREMKEEIKLLKAENKGIYEYMQSEEYKNGEQELPNLIAEKLNTQYMQKKLNELQELNNQIKTLREQVKNNPNDYKAIQEQIETDIAAKKKLIDAAKELKQKYDDKEHELNKLHEMKLEADDEYNRLNLENKALQEKHSSLNKREVVLKEISDKNRLIARQELDNENKQKKLELDIKLREEKAKEDIIKAKIEENQKLNEDNPQYMQQVKDLADKNAMLYRQQRLNEYYKRLNEKDIKTRELKIKAYQTLSEMQQNTSLAGVQQVSYFLDSATNTFANVLQAEDNVNNNNLIIPEIQRLKIDFDKDGAIWQSITGYPYPFVVESQQLNDLLDVGYLKTFYNKYNQECQKARANKEKQQAAPPQNIAPQAEQNNSQSEVGADNNNNYTHFSPLAAIQGRQQQNGQPTWGGQPGIQVSFEGNAFDGSPSEINPVNGRPNSDDSSSE